MDVRVVPSQGSAVNLNVNSSLTNNGTITLTDGQVDQTNFHQYTVLRINEMPREIEIHIVPSANPPSGVGEPGTPPIAPAGPKTVPIGKASRARWKTGCRTPCMKG